MELETIGRMQVACSRFGMVRRVYYKLTRFYKL